MVEIQKIETRDVRFPTSLDKTGSDAMNTAGDYSAAYCILKTNTEYTGHGMVSYDSTPYYWKSTILKESADVHNWPRKRHCLCRDTIAWSTHPT